MTTKDVQTTVTLAVTIEEYGNTILSQQQIIGSLQNENAALKEQMKQQAAEGVETKE